MKEDSESHLRSIRRGLWLIAGVILVIFGYENTDIEKTEVGSAIAILGLVAGILMIAYVVGALLFRLYTVIQKLADEENQSK